MLSASYLGPSNYGLLAYAGAIVSFFVPIMQLGLHSTLVSEFIKTPEEEGKVLGTAVSMTISSSLLCILSVSLIAYLSSSGNPNTTLVCIVYACSLFFQAWETIQYLYQAKLLSKYTAIVSLVAYVVVSIYKLLLLINQKSYKLRQLLINK